MASIVTCPRAHRLMVPRITIAAAILIVTAAFVNPAIGQPAWRQAAPWCAYMGGGYGFDCSYFTFEQCMETARGLGNFCQPNPRAQVYVDGRGRRRARARHYQYYR